MGSSVFRQYLEGTKSRCNPPCLLYSQYGISSGYISISSPFHIFTLRSETNPLLKGMDSRTSPCHEKSAEDASLKRQQSLWVWYQEGRFVLAHGFGGFQAKGAMLQNTLDGITCREHVRVQCEVEPVGQLLFTTICSQSN